LRFTLLVGATPGNDMNISVKKVEANRNFANKLWNIGRFVINSVEILRDQRLETSLQPQVSDYTLADSWIWAKLQRLIRDVERLFQNFQYGEAGRQIYEFVWSDFADWYVEIAKEQLKNDEMKSQTAATLARVFEMCLRLLHPFTPFVTEEIWGHLYSTLRESPASSLSKDWPNALIAAQWPQPRDPEDWEESALANFTLIQDSIRAIRNFHAEKNIKPSQRHGVTYVNRNKAALYRENLPMIAALSNTDLSQSFAYEGYQPEETATYLVAGSTEIYLNMEGTERSEEDKVRFEKELKEAQSHIERLEKLLAGDFASKAPEQLVQKERDKLEGYRETAEKIKAQLK
jgi:valyl-tRNA synthetase